MAGDAPVPIYHFTDASNLPGILEVGEIYCKSRLPTGLQAVDISHYDIQQRRQTKLVDCGPGGVLHDYVPTYFGTKSPMMFSISRGGVEGCSSDTKRLVYLVSSVQSIQKAGTRFVFSDGQATKAFTKFYEDAANLDKVDWDIMEELYWNDTEEDGDRKRRRQAEFLIYKTFSWQAVEFLAVKNQNLKNRLDKYLSETWPRKIKPVKVRSSWYF